MGLVIVSTWFNHHIFIFYSTNSIGVSNLWTGSCRIFIKSLERFIENQERSPYTSISYNLVLWAIFSFLASQCLRASVSLNLIDIFLELRTIMMNFLSFKLIQLARQGPAVAVTPVLIPMYSYRSWSNLWVFALCNLLFTTVFPFWWERSDVLSLKISEVSIISHHCGRHRIGLMRLPRDWGLRVIHRRCEVWILPQLAGKSQLTCLL